jgi:hypothetical protein
MREERGRGGAGNVLNSKVMVRNIIILKLEIFSVLYLIRPNLINVLSTYLGP